MPNQRDTRGSSPSSQAGEEVEAESVAYRVDSVEAVVARSKCGVDALGGEETLPFQDDPDNSERVVFRATPRTFSVPHELFVRYYQEIRADSPHKSDQEMRMNALQAAILHTGIVERKKRMPHKVHLISPGGFERALFGAVETTGRIPAVKSGENGGERTTR